MKLAQVIVTLVATGALAIAAESPQGYKRVQDGSGVLSIAIPRDWQETAKPDGIKAGSADGKVALLIEFGPRLAKSLEAFAGQVHKTYRARSETWTEIDRTRVRIGDVDALCVRVNARIKGADFVWESYPVVAPRYQIAMNLACPKESYNASLPVIRAIAHSFRLTERGAAAREATKTVEATGGAFTVDVPKSWRVQHFGSIIKASDPTGQLKATAMAAPKQYGSVEALADAMTAHWQANEPGWKVDKRTPFNQAGLRGATVIAKTQQNGADRFVAANLMLSDARQFVLRLSCPAAAVNEHLPTLTAISKSWRFDTNAVAQAQPKPAREPGPKARPTPQPQPAPLPLGPAPEPAEPEALELTEVRGPGGLYAFKAPAKWKLNKVGRYTIVTSADRAAAITVIAQPKMMLTFEQYLKHGIDLLHQAYPAFEEKGQRRITVAGRPAVYIRGTSHGQDGPLTGDYIFLEARNHFLILSCVAPTDDYPELQKVFLETIQGFRLDVDSPEPMLPLQ